MWTSQLMVCGSILCVNAHDLFESFLLQYCMCRLACCQDLGITGRALSLMRGPRINRGLPAISIIDVSNTRCLCLLLKLVHVRFEMHIGLGHHHRRIYPVELQVVDIYLYPELFSTENDLMTPTFKIKRPQAKKTFQEALNAMYAKLPNST